MITIIIMRFFLILILLLGLPFMTRAEEAPGTPANQTNQPNQGRGEELFAQVSALESLSFGPEDGKDLYMLADPACPHCAALDKTLMTEIAAGKNLRLHVIPAPVLSQESQIAVLQIYSAPNPSAAWQTFISENKLPVEKREEAVVLASAKHAEANFNTMKRWNLRSVPTLIWRGTDGRVMIMFGTPNDMQALWNSMGFAQ